MPEDRTVSMTRRHALALAAGGLVAFAGIPAQAADLPGPMVPGIPLRFDIVVLNELIGIHRVEFTGRGDQFSVTTTIDVDAKLLGLPVLRYVQTTSEAWNGGRLQRFLSEGEQNGHRFRAAGQAIDEGFEMFGEDGRSVAPRDTMLATCWSPLMLERSRVINPKRGKLKRQTVESREPTTFMVGNAPTAVTRYVVDSVIDGTIYYDDRQTWVAAAFEKRGAQINYVLRA